MAKELTELETTNSHPTPTQRNWNQVTRLNAIVPPISVIHNIPGRVRFRVCQLQQNANYGDRLQSLLVADPLVKKVKVNRSAASVTIFYHRKGLNSDRYIAHFLNMIQLAIANNQITPIAKKADLEPEPNYFSNLRIPLLATALSILAGPIGIGISPLLVAGTISIATIPVAKRAYASITEDRKLNIDFLDFLAIAISTCQGHFITPSLMLGLIELGEAIRDRTARQSKKQTLDLLGSLSSYVWVERSGEQVEIPLPEVQKGDVVIVYPGDQIPVDGRVLRGSALVDEQKLTGESVPVMREKGQEVLASTLVQEGQIYILVDRVGDETRAGQSIKLMQEAPVHDTRMENYAAKLANRAVVPTLLLAGIVFSFSRNLARAASILTLDFATGVRVSVPTTVLSALTYAAKRGILIRSGRALEQLAEVDTIVFDKTGTLTLGEVAVTKVKPVQTNISEERLLQIAATAEKGLTHPVADAIIRYAQQQEVILLERGEFDYEVGLGVRATIEGAKILVGSDRFLNNEGIPTGEKPKGTSRICIAQEGVFLGSVEYSDQLRPESVEVINRLQHIEGIEVHMLTGDNRHTAAAVALSLGIPKDQTHAEAFPEQKAEVVKGLHDAGQIVAFAGDGINDSPALAYADVSVSFASGSEIARETADVVLMENNLRSLVEAIVIARQAKNIIYQNTGIVIAPNLVALIMAATVGLTPFAATVVNNGSSIVAGVNGLRPILTGQKDKKQLV